MFSQFKEILLIALNSIKANKARSILTTLGIVIGVCSVVLMATAIKGVDNSFEEGISSLGSDVLYVDKFAWFSNEEFFKQRNRKNITLEQYYRFRDLVKLPEATAPSIFTVRNAKYKEKELQNAFIVGSTVDYIRTTNFTFSYGRFYSEVEDMGGREVVVLGSEVAENIFSNINPIGKNVKIGGVNYEVIGILNKQGSFLLGNFNPDKQIFIPIKSLLKNFGGLTWRSITINVRAKNNKLIDETKFEVESAMRIVRKIPPDKPSDFAINQSEGLTNIYNSVVGVIQIGGFFITGLALFVGAIGIMNIMFVSVKERTREIGIRKAIGATNRNILYQFIFEALVICMIGGLIGLFIAVILSRVVNQFLPTSIQINAVIIAIFISAITGVISGFAPAYKASKLDPVDSLRYE